MALALGSVGALARPIVANGAVLTPARHALYTFDNDVAGSGTSVCNAPCSNIFPPYLAKPAEKATGAFSIVARRDGTRQWAYKGKPLYTFYGDEKPGDEGGDGMNRNLWHAARE